MKSTFGMFVLPVLLLSAGIGWAEKSHVTIVDASVKPVTVDPGETVLISCRVVCPDGPSSVEAVAATADHGNWVTTFPKLYDDGTHGDEVANDSVYSLEIQAAYGPGEEKIVFIAVDRDRNEIESEPLILKVE